MSKAKNSLLVTPFSQFYRAVNGEETRYFPTATDASKPAARAFDAKNDLTIIGGFAVYDTTIGTGYAVALYATAEEAAKHKPSDAPKAPEHAVEPEPMPEPADIVPAASASPVNPPMPTGTIQDDLDEEDDGKPAKKRRK
jgi:hypothetical protein